LGDIISVAGSSTSVFTSKSKWGAINKHCTVEGCSTKKVIDGSNWPRHVKGHTDKGLPKESVCFVSCQGAECDMCPQGKYTKTSHWA